jgi:hypothetical protein
MQMTTICSAMMGREVPCCLPVFDWAMIVQRDLSVSRGCWVLEEETVTTKGNQIFALILSNSIEESMRLEQQGQRQ